MSNKAKTTTMKKDGKPALTLKLRFLEFQDAAGWDVTILGELSEVVRGGSPRPIDGFITKVEPAVFMAAIAAHENRRLHNLI